MDKDIDIMFCVEPHYDLLPQSRASVVLDQANDRKKSDSFEKQILSIWENRKKENPTLFNGTKFRLHKIEYSSGHIKFYLGVTCYRDFIGTNWSPDAKILEELGIKEFGDSQAYMSDAMGVGALVLTRDNDVIFMKRSMYCGEAKGLWDIPGGHAEPQEIVGKLPVEDIDVSKLDPSQVVSEIYDSIVREVVDEVNIPRSCLSEPEFIGVARNKTAAGRPSVEFLIRCSLSSEEVKHMYHQGNQEEAYETTNISLQQLDSVLHMDTSDSFWQNMAPSAKGCMILYKLHKTEQLPKPSGNS